MRAERLRGPKVDCPFCHGWDSLVIGGRFNDATQCYERRRKCQNPSCLKGFITKETVVKFISRVQDVAPPDPA